MLRQVGAIGRFMKIMFVCHGNICRSVMAEYILLNMLKENEIEGVTVSSRGVSSEEEGNDIYPPAKRVLRKHSIDYGTHSAHRISESDFTSSDIVYALDESNYSALTRRFSPADKIRLLVPGGVDDPWYTGDFETAYLKISQGCLNIVKELKDDRIDNN